MTWPTYYLFALFFNDMVHTLSALHLNCEIVSAVLDSIIMNHWLTGKMRLYFRIGHLQLSDVVQSDLYFSFSNY